MFSRLLEAVSDVTVLAGEGPFPYAVFRVTLKFQRRAGYYVLTMILPCMVLALLSAFTFIVPIQSGEKMSLSITILLSFSIFMLLLDENTPPTSGSLPFLGMQQQTQHIVIALWTYEAYY